MAKTRSFSFQKRLRIYWRDNFTCVYCGRPIHPLSEDLTIDHRDPLGGDEDDNLATACRSCNSAKGARTVFHPISPRDVMEAIERPLSPPEIVAAVAREWHIGVLQMTGRGRDRQSTAARAVAAHRLREAGLTLAAIASCLGRSDHSTIVHLLRSHSPEGRIKGR